MLDLEKPPGKRRAPLTEGIFCHCGAPLGLVGNKIVCLDCGQPGSPSNPLQVKHDRERQELEDAERRMKEIAARERQAEKERRAKEEEAFTERMKAGAILQGLNGGPVTVGYSGNVEPVGAKTFRVTIGLVLPFDAGGEVNAAAERRLKNDWLEEFQQTEHFKTAVRLKDQLAESKKQLKAAEDSVQTVEQKLKAALTKGADVAKIETELGNVRGKISVLTTRCQTLEQLASEAEKTARQHYVSFLDAKKKTMLAEMTKAFETLSFEWISRANVRELLELLGIQKAFLAVEPPQAGMPPQGPDVAGRLNF